MDLVLVSGNVRQEDPNCFFIADRRMNRFHLRDVLAISCETDFIYVLLVHVVVFFCKKFQKVLLPICLKPELSLAGSHSCFETFGVVYIKVENEVFLQFLSNDFAVIGWSFS
eukprot:snap_masked-scaffold_3-processed-gene-1.16-mRNA-1 protein AED:1.00 eAED:1.00 QI:0/0/0/0/1/1/5/0/111